jgi:hypothetical protein
MYVIDLQSAAFDRLMCFLIVLTAGMLFVRIVLL